MKTHICRKIFCFFVSVWFYKWLKVSKKLKATRFSKCIVHTIKYNLDKICLLLLKFKFWIKLSSIYLNLNLHFIAVKLQFDLAYSKTAVHSLWPCEIIFMLFNEPHEQKFLLIFSVELKTRCCLAQREKSSLCWIQTLSDWTLLDHNRLKLKRGCLEDKPDWIQMTEVRKIKGKLTQNVSYKDSIANVLYIDKDNLRQAWDGPDCSQISVVEQGDWSVPAEQTHTHTMMCDIK